jgi:flagellar biosynthetic protein FliS
MNKTAYKAYQMNTTVAIGNAECTALLFSKAAQHIQNAIEAIEAKKPEERFNETEKARTILVHLQASLDRESSEAKVQDLIKILDAFYMRSTVFLTQINIRNDVKLAEALIHNFREMAMSFHKVQQENDQKDKGRPIELRETYGASPVGYEQGSEQPPAVQGLRESLLL